MPESTQARWLGGVLKELPGIALLALTRLSVAKPLAVIAIFLAVAFAGILSYFSLPINLLPS